MIYYLCYYTHPKIADQKRVVAPAAINKAGYIISTLDDISEEQVEVVSLSGTKAKRFVKGTKVKLTDKTSIKTFFSANGKPKPIQAISLLLKIIMEYSYLLFHVKKSDTLITYHSVLSMKLASFIKKLKKCKLIIEVEEIYGDVYNDNDIRNKELKCFEKADGYIFVNAILRKKINIGDKPYLIANGTYKSIPKTNSRFLDNKIHVVYAGTLGDTKCGPIYGVNAAKYLDENFCIDILGHGSESDLQVLRSLIDSINEQSICRVEYKGFKNGDEFNSFIQACDIGLSTQRMDVEFNNTSFPSKILMYMSNGLKVVSPRIPAIETSDVGKYIHYYESPDPKAIADAICSAVEAEQIDSRAVLDKLDMNFKENLSKMILGINQK